MDFVRVICVFLAHCIGIIIHSFAPDARVRVYVVPKLEQTKT